MRKLSAWALAVMFFCGLPGVSLADQNDTVPRFEDYPVQVYTGPVAAPDDPDLNKHEREELTRVLAEGTVVAGEYVLEGKSCGTGGCCYSALYSKRTGKFLAGFMAYSSEDDKMRVGEEPREYRADSRLLITGGVPEEEVSRGFDHTNYYVVEDGNLKLIRSVLVPANQARQKEGPTPKFAAYPKRVYTGPAAALDVPEFSEVERENAAECLSGPVQFGGDYVVCESGCGTGCSSQIVLDKNRGRMLHRFTATWGLAENYDLPIGEEILEMRPDSGLLVTGGVAEDIVEPNPDDGPPLRIKDGVQGMYSTMYYVSRYRELKLIRIVKTPL